MKIPMEEIVTILAQFNPWWKGEKISDLPVWKRTAFSELFQWVNDPPVPRAILLSGARQVGKTTLLMQIIAKLLERGVPPSNILYTTFDHNVIKLAGIDAVLEAWRTREPKAPGLEYLFLDEAQFIRNSGTWIKHQVDFNKARRILFTGSAMPLIYKEQESGVGRWHVIQLATLSFFEYLQFKSEDSAIADRDKTISALLRKKFSEAEALQIEQKLFDGRETINSGTILEQLPKLPPLKQLNDLFHWPQQNFLRVAEHTQSYVGHFHEYLLRGGFPQTARLESITQAQRLMREDIIDKVLKRDMTALFGVRRVLDLEQTFLYLCMHDSGLLDLQVLCANLEVKRPTAQKFIELLEAAHLIYRLQPFGYGKDILRAKYKIYLADAAIAPAVLLKGKSLLDDPKALGIAAETAVFKHLYIDSHSSGARFSYWRGTKDLEVDLIAEMGSTLIPIEVKYRTRTNDVTALKGLTEFCVKKSPEHAYVVTKSLQDFGPLQLPETKTKVMKIPAALLCYWMGEKETSLSQESKGFL